MARKRLLVSSAGGIAAGSPFVLNQGLIVGQATPPTAISARFGQAADAMQSFIAPGFSGGANSFVIGPGADNRGAASTIIMGSAVLQTGAAGQGIKSVLIGGSIDPGAAATSRANIVYIGWDFTLTDAGSAHGSNVFIGTAITTAGGTDVGSTVMIGTTVSTDSGDGVVIGQGTVGKGECVVIGKGAGASGAQAVCIGKTSSGGLKATAVGFRARADNSSVAVGYFCDALGTDQAHVGRDITGTFNRTVAIGALAAVLADDSIAIGKSATTIVANQCVIGSLSSPITSVNIGGGTSGVATGTAELRTTFGFGADIQGWTLRLSGGQGTGNAVVTGIEFFTGAPLGSGSTLQTLTKQVSILQSAGGAAAPNLRFDNVTSGAAAQAGTLLNAPTAGNPSFWLPISIAGAVRYIPCWT
jgi:hypothetical protein